MTRKVNSVENNQVALERHQIGLLRTYSCISVTISVLKHQHANYKRFIEFFIERNHKNVHNLNKGSLLLIELWSVYGS